MTVEELVEHLKTLPQEIEVEVLMYSCGDDLHVSTDKDFFYHNEGRGTLELQADWN